MHSDPDPLTFGHAVLTKNRPKSWDSAWDTRRTAPAKASQSLKHAETANLDKNQSDDTAVPPTQPLRRETVGQEHSPGTTPGTVVGQQNPQPARHYARVLTALQSRSPPHVEIDRWQQALANVEALLACRGEQAGALGWRARELFGLHTPPERPSAGHERLSRYDQTGLVWAAARPFRGRPDGATAAIQTASGGILTYRKYSKPALGQVGDSLEDFNGAAW